MKKVALIALTLTLIGAAAGGAFLVSGGGFTPTPEEAICTQLVELCDVEEDARLECVDDIGQWMEKHPKETSTLATCVTDATNCSGVSGCMAGAGLRTLGAGVGDFFKGVGKALGMGR